MGSAGGLAAGVFWVFFYMKPVPPTQPFNTVGQDGILRAIGNRPLRLTCTVQADNPTVFVKMPWPVDVSSLAKPFFSILPGIPGSSRPR
jgi:hypothetical protein